MRPQPSRPPGQLPVNARALQAAVKTFRSPPPSNRSESGGGTSQGAGGVGLALPVPAPPPTGMPPLGRSPARPRDKSRDGSHVSSSPQHDAASTNDSFTSASGSARNTAVGATVSIEDADDVMLSEALKTKKKLLNGTNIEYVYPTGSVYRGGFKDGKLHGYGRYAYQPSGDTYEGEWKADVKHGRGTYIYASGDRYTGEWAMGHKEGKGTYSFTSGDEYVGSWHADKIDGYGVFKTMHNNSRYEGNWKNSYRHGHGVLYSGNGDRYDGQWVNGKEEGLGVLVFPTRDLYCGEWKGGQMDGKAILREGANIFAVEYVGGYLITKIAIPRGKEPDEPWMTVYRAYKRFTAREGDRPPSAPKAEADNNTEVMKLRLELEILRKKYDALLKEHTSASERRVTDAQLSLSQSNNASSSSVNNHSDEAAWEADRETIRKLEQLVDSLQEQLDAEKLRCEDLEARERQLTSELKVNESDRDRLASLLDEAEGERQAAEEMEEENDELRKQLSQLEQRQVQIVGDLGISSIDDVSGLKAKMESLVREAAAAAALKETIQELRAHNTDLIKKNSEATKRSEGLEIDNKALKREAEEVRARTPPGDEDITTHALYIALREENASLASEVSDWKAKLESLEEQLARKKEVHEQELQRISEEAAALQQKNREESVRKAEVAVQAALAEVAESHGDGIATLQEKIAVLEDVNRNAMCVALAEEKRVLESAKTDLEERVAELEAMSEVAKELEVSKADLKELSSEAERIATKLQVSEEEKVMLHAKIDALTLELAAAHNDGKAAVEAAEMVHRGTTDRQVIALQQQITELSDITNNEMYVALSRENAELGESHAQLASTVATLQRELEEQKRIAEERVESARQEAARIASEAAQKEIEAAREEAVRKASESTQMEVAAARETAVKASTAAREEIETVRQETTRNASEAIQQAVAVARQEAAEQAAASAQVEIDALREQLRTKEKDVQDAMSKLQQLDADSQKRYDDIRTELTQQLNDAQSATRSASESEQKSAAAAQQASASAQAEIDALRDQLRTKENEVKEAMAQLRQLDAESQKRCDDLRTELTQQLKDAQEATRSASESGKQSAEAARKDAASQASASAQAEIDALRDQLRTKENEVKEAMAQLRQLDAESQKRCDDIRAELTQQLSTVQDEHKKTLQHATDKLSAAQTEHNENLKRAADQLSDARAGHKEVLDRVTNELAEAKASLAQTQQTPAKAESTHSSAEVDALILRIQQLEAALRASEEDKAAADQRIEELSAELRLYRVKIKSLEKQIAGAADFDNDTTLHIRQLADENAELKERLDEVDSRRQQLEAQVLNREQKCAELERELMQLARSKTVDPALLASLDRKMDLVSQLQAKNAELARMVEEMEMEGDIQASEKRAKRREQRSNDSSPARECVAEVESLKKELKKEQRRHKKCVAERDTLAKDLYKNQVLYARVDRTLQNRNGRYTVVAKVRPPLKGEGASKGATVLRVNELDATQILVDGEQRGGVVSANGNSVVTSFQMDFCADPSTSWESMFNEIRQPISFVKDGYHVGFVTCGSIGTGKTTMITELLPFITEEIENHLAILRCNTLMIVSLSVAMVEVGSFGCIDCASGGPIPELLRDAKGHVVPNGASFVDCKMHSDGTQDSPTRANGQRHTHNKGHADSVKTQKESLLATILRLRGRRRQQNGRSHLWTRIKITAKHRVHQSVFTGYLTLFDLCGGGSLMEQQGDLESGRYANRSERFVDDIMNALASDSEGVPYTASPETMLLADVLGGNCMTTLLLALSPSEADAMDNVKTLCLGQSAASCVNYPVVQDFTDRDAVRWQRIMQETFGKDDIASEPVLGDIAAVRDAF